MIGDGAGHAYLERASVHGGMRPLRTVAAQMVEAGTTSRAEVERVLGQTTDQPPGAPRAAAPAAPVVPRQPPTGDEPPHVLLVDDDSVSRRLARTLLEKAGYAISEASNGITALEMLGSGEHFSLMVLDLEMPRMDGRGVLSRVRESDDHIGLPVLVLTGTADAEAEAQLMDAGADDYIRKPLDPARFLARVKAALRRAGHSYAEAGR
jgi:CheY-like chemotaxis protein